MSSPERPPPRRAASGDLEALRSRTLAELEHQLDRRAIDQPEFDRRSDLALEATSARELQPLLIDLLDTAAAPRAGAPAPAAAGTTALAPDRSEPEHDWVVAVMSGSNRSGRWDPPEHVTAVALMGGVRLDFREAAFLEGVVTRVAAFCLMGGCEIIVPPDIHVSVAGTGLLGGFGHVAQTAASADAPRLHITGLAIMGGVEIKVRELGDDTGGTDSP